MGKPDRRRQEQQKRKHAGRSGDGTEAKARRGKGEVPSGHETVRAHRLLERATVALSALALFQCLLIVLLSLVVSFDWLHESSLWSSPQLLEQPAPADDSTPTPLPSPDPLSPDASPTRRPAPDDSPLYLSPYEATQLVKSAASIIGRFPVERIRDTNSLRDVDINTPQRVEHLKGLLRLSIEANMGGSLDISSFTDMLELTPGSTVAAAGDHLVTAYQLAWSPD